MGGKRDVSSVVIVVPVLDRPQNVKPLMVSVDTSMTKPYRLLFVASEGDAAEIAVLKATNADYVTVGGRGSYAQKVNYGASVSTEPLLFAAADDLRFHPGWFEAILKCLEDENVHVVGTNDMGNPRTIHGEHSTHTLFTREYIDDPGGVIDGPPGMVLCEQYEHQYCNPPEASIWMGDLTFKSLGDVRVGDEVMGWAPGPNLRRSRAVESAKWRSEPRQALTVATVKRILTRVSPIVRVTTESGRTLRCTPDHRWLNGLNSSSAQWVLPEVGRWLSHVIDEPDPLPVGLERTAGWLAGIYDGEGSWIQIAQCPVANPKICDAIVEALNKLDIPHTVGGRGDAFITLTGGRQGYLNFLLRVQPVKRWSITNQFIGTKRFRTKDRIVAVEPDGEGEVISMTTSTGNYVAWGYASKNCDDEAIETAQSRFVYAHAYQSHVEHLHYLWHKGEMDSTYEKGLVGTGRGRLIFRRRRRLWRI